MDDQLDGFDFVKIEYGRRFYAYNTENNFIVFWLGSDESEDVMKKRIEDYGGFKHVKAKDFTRTEALKYYHKARKANDKAQLEEFARTATFKNGKLVFREESRYGERFNPLTKWKEQARF